MERRSFTEYVRDGDPGLEGICGVISTDVWYRLVRAEHIDTRRKLLLWAEERWPLFYKRTGPEFHSLEVCMKLFWASFLVWAESEG